MRLFILIGNAGVIYLICIAYGLYNKWMRYDTVIAQYIVNA